MTSFTNPYKERIRDKFENREYQIIGRTELVAHCDLQPSIPEKRWLPPVRQYIVDNLDASVFTRVWRYAVAENRIVCSHPSL